MIDKARNIGFKECCVELAKSLHKPQQLYTQQSHGLLFEETRHPPVPKAPTPSRALDIKQPKKPAAR